MNKKICIVLLSAMLLTAIVSCRIAVMGSLSDKQAHVTIALPANTLPVVSNGLAGDAKAYMAMDSTRLKLIVSGAGKNIQSTDFVLNERVYTSSVSVPYGKNVDFTVEAYDVENTCYARGSKIINVNRNTQSVDLMLIPTPTREQGITIYINKEGPANYIELQIEDGTTKDAVSVFPFGITFDASSKINDIKLEPTYISVSEQQSWTPKEKNQVFYLMVSTSGSNGSDILVTIATADGVVLVRWEDTVTPAEGYSCEMQILDTSGNRIGDPGFSIVGPYSVVYHSNNGSDASAYVDFGYAENEEADLLTSLDDQLQSFKKDSYYIAGWNTKADGSGKTYGLGSSVPIAPPKLTITESTDLYAIWVPNYLKTEANCSIIMDNNTHTHTCDLGVTGVDILSYSTVLVNSTEINIPEGITAIGYTDLRVDLPARGVLELAESPLVNLTLSLPKSLEVVGAKAFYNCTLFNEIRLHENVTHIGVEAFSSGYALTLKEVIIDAGTPPELSGLSFDIDNGLTILVQQDCVGTYKDNWSEYADSIYPSSYYRVEVNGLEFLEENYNNQDGGFKIVFEGTSVHEKEFSLYNPAIMYVPAGAYLVYIHYSEDNETWQLISNKKTISVPNDKEVELDPSS
ncbi:MAG TPA: leucine-rich repeat protein [Treponemataceae bacterium]|nr:leucine-rich repeat protein [Treponemataceae bacterium]